MTAPPPAQKNLAMLHTVAERLGPLRSEVMFLGGTILPLLVAEPVAADIRAAKDVDIIIDMPSKAELYRFEDHLWDLGFKRQSVGAASHWRLDQIGVDVLNADPDIVRFNNRWGAEAMRWAATRDLDGGLRINVITAPYYLATKVEAFYRRGRNRYWASRDIYDLLLVMRGCTEIEALIREQTSPELRTHLVAEFRKLSVARKCLAGQPSSDKRYVRFFRQLEPEVVDRIQHIAAMRPADQRKTGQAR
jgi:Nucleotidyl transferase AbiEii toxin, Type IV TA system